MCLFISAGLETLVAQHSMPSRHLCKRWRTVHSESVPEQHLLYHSRKGCQKIKPMIAWGDARLPHRHASGGAWKHTKSVDSAYSPVISASPYTLGRVTNRKVRFAQPVRFEDVGTETDSPHSDIYPAVSSAKGQRVRPFFNWFERLTNEIRRSEDDKDEWAAFEYTPQAYVSVWQSTEQPKGFLARLKSSLSQIFHKKPSPLPPAQFIHADPLDSSRYPMLPKFGAKQYHPDTVGAETLNTNGTESWTTTGW